MGKERAEYYDGGPVGNLDVIFIVRDSGRTLVRKFDSPYLARVFVNKVRRSKKMQLVSYPNC